MAFDIIRVHIRTAIRLADNALQEPIIADKWYDHSAKRIRSHDLGERTGPRYSRIVIQSAA